MQLKKFLTHRATRTTISISLVVISIVAMVNAPDVSNSLLAIAMFAIANIIHINRDMFRSHCNWHMPEGEAISQHIFVVTRPYDRYELTPKNN